MESIHSLMARHARTGRVTWIGVRPARRKAMVAQELAHLTLDGLSGDHRNKPGARAVTLIQAEHLPVIASLAGVNVPPAVLRRNLVVEGINLAALRGKTVQIGETVLQITGPCAPCSRMEEALGPGGYSAVRHHGGWCAEVTMPGVIALGDRVTSA